MVCPSCGEEADIHDIGFRLGTSVQRCSRCGTAAPAELTRADWTLVASSAAGDEAVCPSCLHLVEVAVRMGVARPLA
jgi:DNA-directed RNA polymerase subunit RPC12/RpoP